MATKEWKNGFKVTRLNNESALMIHGATVVYETDKITKPKKKCGPLAVFVNKEDAEKFKSCEEHQNENESEGPPKLKIRRCKYIQSKIRLSMALNARALWGGYFANQREWPNGDPMPILYVAGLPTGSALADVVKCLE